MTSNYPLPRPDDDPRFTLGLAVDLRDVLTEHGYPDMTGMDIVNLQQALFGFLYEPVPVTPYRENGAMRGLEWT